VNVLPASPAGIAVQTMRGTGCHCACTVVSSVIGAAKLNGVPPVWAVNQSTKVLSGVSAALSPSGRAARFDS